MTTLTHDLYYILEVIIQLNYLAILVTYSYHLYYYNQSMSLKNRLSTVEVNKYTFRKNSTILPPTLKHIRDKQKL